MRILHVVIIATMAFAIQIEANSIFEKTFKMLHHEPPPPERQSRAEIEEKWITQKLDNFDSDNTETWQMRYMANDEHFQNGGPIFIFVGGEWEISKGYITGGHFYDMAKNKNGYLFYTEHRYYGKSHPTKDLSVENLKYLSVLQALADLAEFIKQIKNDIAGLKNSKVILAGGSYSATMVTWFKKLYPELAIGSWASSAPLFAKVNFQEYKIVAGNSIKTVGGTACYNRIDNGIKKLEKMFDDNKIGEIKSLLKLCDNFNSENQLDVWSLFSTISDIFAGLVQASNKGDIENACKKIMSEDDDLSGVASWYLYRLGGSGCFDVTYDDTLISLKQTAYTSNIFRQWFFQTCTEYGWYQTSTAANQPFGTKFPAELYEKICQDTYGISNETLYENIEKTNKLFGGLKPNVENVFMTHGSLDPWNAMGIHEHENGESNVIPLYAHCKDFNSIRSSDSIEMRASKQKLQETVNKWLAED